MIHLNRRGFIQTGALAGVGTLALSSQACKPKDVGAEVAAITSFLHEISPLLPAQAQLITKIVKVASDFNEAYQAGKFENATSFFANLSDLIDQLTGDLDVNVPPQVKIAIAIVNAAVRAIAVLMHSQATPAIRAMSATATTEQKRGAAKIEKLSDPDAIDAVFRALKAKP